MEPQRRAHCVPKHRRGEQAVGKIELMIPFPCEDWGMDQITSWGLFQLQDL